MKHIVTVPAPLLRAARLFQSDNDLRTYLRGVHLNPAGYVESSDGHVAFRAPCLSCKGLDKSIILRIQGSTVGKGDELARVHLDDDGLGWITFGGFDDDGNPIPVRCDNNGMVVRIMAQAIDRKFPDFDRVIADENTQRLPVGKIGVDAEFVAAAGRAVKALGYRTQQLKLEFYGASKAISARAAPGGGYEHRIMIMPCRL